MGLLCAASLHDYAPSKQAAAHCKNPMGGIVGLAPDERILHQHRDDAHLTRG